MNRNLMTLMMAVLVLGGIGLSWTAAPQATAQDGVVLDDAVQNDVAPVDAVPQTDPLDTENETRVAAGQEFNKWTALVGSITIFVLAIFVGFEIITKVPPTLHTPLMSGSNAISGIAIVGALLVAATGEHWFSAALGFLAVILAPVNVVGGYLVTHRMLAMFQTKR